MTAPEQKVGEDITFEWEVREDSTPYSSHMIAGCMAGIVEHSTMFPFDNIKVISGMSFRQIVRQLYVEGGVGAFYRGIGLVACGSMPAHAAFFSTYEYARVKLNINDEEHHPYLFALTGAIATFLHDLIMTPIDVLKQRKQISNLPSLQLLKDIGRVEGYRSLHRSFPVTYAMNVPAQAILVSTNETLKVQAHRLIEMNFLTHFFCAGIAGALSATLTTPLDVVKTKLQVQDIYTEHCNRCEKKKEGNSACGKIVKPELQQPFVCKEAKYVSFFQTLKLVRKEEGLRGLFRGYGSRMIIASPSSAISWATYESLKKMLHNKKRSSHH